MATDLSGIIRGTGIQLESAAKRQFGQVANDGVRGILNGAFGTGQKANDAAAAAAAPRDPGIWDPTHYSSTFASGAGGLDPKTKFLFKVKFEFHPAVIDLASSLGNDLKDAGRNLTFTVKQIDLPKVDFEYEEINLYNYKTKILKTINYQDLTMSFYDDISNHTLSFLNVYMMMNMPITRNEQNATAALENHGFAFADDYYGLDTSVRSLLPNDAKQILSKMTIEQFYIVRGGEASGKAANYTLFNSFIFLNPRIKTLDLSDQDHESTGTANIISVNMDFDSIHIKTGQKTENSINETYSQGDMLNGKFITGSKVSGPDNSAGKFGNQMVNIIASQARKAVTSSISGALAKTKLNTIAGGALSGAIDSVASGLGTQAARTLQALGKTGLESVSASVRQTPSVTITDNSTSNNIP